MKPAAPPRDADDLVRLPAHQLLGLLLDGRLASEELTRACLARIEAREPEVQAWAFLDPAHALAQARERDAAKRAGRPLGPLHGLPVGVKDIFDTADMPTENGTVLLAGRRPTRDAAVVERLRAAGAVVMGKTVTTELAVYAPGKTRNPRHPEHTPGGSSSGSAAAVADHMVPLAIGSQTNGSVIRPAAFCGVLGFKPSAGLISRHGVLAQSPMLDHVGTFANHLADLALLTEPLIGFDARDQGTRPTARP
ncbi:MAG TPA: amidase, partial [Geminicoccaceae bacterium]|nr:amidase [Geminicoccaceae bacterium]